MPKITTRSKPDSTDNLDYSRFRVKVNWHLVLLLVDSQTTGRDHISAQFVHLYSLLVYSIPKQALNTTIKRSKGIKEKACDVQMHYGGYTETRTLYIVYLAG